MSDRENTLTLTGNGEVLDPLDGVVGMCSGPFS